MPSVIVFAFGLAIQTSFGAAVGLRTVRMAGPFLFASLGWRIFAFEQLDFIMRCYQFLIFESRIFQRGLDDTSALSGGGLGLKIDPLGFLLNEPDRRSADLLIIPAIIYPHDIHYLFRTFVDFAIVSPFWATFFITPPQMIFCSHFSLQEHASWSKRASVAEEEKYFNLWNRSR